MQTKVANIEPKSREQIVITLKKDDKLPYPTANAQSVKFLPKNLRPHAPYDRNASQPKIQRRHDITHGLNLSVSHLDNIKTSQDSKQTAETIARIQTRNGTRSLGPNSHRQSALVSNNSTLGDIETRKGGRQLQVVSQGLGMQRSPAGLMKVQTVKFSEKTKIKVQGSQSFRRDGEEKFQDYQSIQEKSHGQKVNQSQVLLPDIGQTNFNFRTEDYRQQQQSNRKIHFKHTKNSLSFVVPTATQSTDGLMATEKDYASEHYPIQANPDLNLLMSGHQSTLFQNQSLGQVGKSLNIPQRQAKPTKRKLQKHRTPNTPLSAALFQEQAVKRDQRVPINLTQQSLNSNSSRSHSGSEQEFHDLKELSKGMTLSKTERTGTSSKVGELKRYGTESKTGLQISLPKINLSSALQSAEMSNRSYVTNMQSVNKQDLRDYIQTVVQKERSIGSGRFTLRIPMLETKIKNNIRRYEEMMNKLGKDEFRRQVEDYVSGTNPFSKFDKSQRLSQHSERSQEPLSNRESLQSLPTGPRLVQLDCEDQNPDRFRRRTKKQPSQRSNKKAQSSRASQSQLQIHLQPLLQNSVEKHQTSTVLNTALVNQTETYTNLSHREFLSHQNRKLFDMVRDKSNPKKDSHQSPKQAKSVEPTIKVDILARNKQVVADPQYFKSRQVSKNYCPEFAEISDDKVHHYWREQFLKEAERGNIVPVSDAKSHQDKLKHLITIEQTPRRDQLPEDDRVMNLVEKSRQKMSLREPKVEQQDDQDSQSEQQSKSLRRQSVQKISSSLTQQLVKISRMLNDLQFSDGKKAGFDQEMRRRLSQMVTAEYRQVLQEKQALLQFCCDAANVDKRRNQDYWEKIKKQHQEVDYRIYNVHQLAQRKKEQQLAKEQHKIEKQKIQEKKQLLEQKWKLAAYKQSKRAKHPRGQKDPSAQISDFDKMHNRVKRAHNKRVAEQRITKLLVFQQGLLDQLDQIQNETQNNSDLEENIDFLNLTEAQIQEQIDKKLDRQLSEIFNASDMFYRYHREVMSNLRALQIRKATKEFARQRTLNKDLKQIDSGSVGSNSFGSSALSFENKSENLSDLVSENQSTESPTNKSKSGDLLNENSGNQDSLSFKGDKNEYMNPMLGGDFDTDTVSQCQSSMVASFSKVIASKISRVLEDIQQDIRITVQKQLEKKLTFNKSFKLKNQGEIDTRQAQASPSKIDKPQYAGAKYLQRFQTQVQPQKQQMKKFQAKLEDVAQSKELVDMLGTGLNVKVIRDAQSPDKQTSQSKRKTNKTQNSKKSKQSREEHKSIDNGGQEISSDRNQKQFVSDALSQGAVPLPLLNKIKSKFLMLHDYRIEPTNCELLIRCLPNLVPNGLQKLVLCNNNLSDHAVAQLLMALADIPEGLKVLAIVQNSFGKRAQQAACDFFIPSAATNALQKLIIKDPLTSSYPFSGSKFMEVLLRNVRTLPRLKQLVLQNVGLKREDLVVVSQFVTDAPAMRFLNISGNGLAPEDFIQMFQIMKPQSYSLVKLNLSWNSACSTNTDTQAKFDDMFADFLRHSKSLQHLDVSGMGFSEQTLEQITLQGIRKSKTLLSVHMAGNLQSKHLLAKMRKWLSAVFKQSPEDEQQKHSKETRLNEELFGGTASLSRGFEGLDTQNLPKTHVFKEESHAYVENALKEDYRVSQVSQELERYINSNEAKLEALLRTNRFQPLISDRIVFQRFLGHHEILNGYRWQETTDDKCYYCHNWAYSVVLWDQRISKQLYRSVPREAAGCRVNHSPITSTVCSIESIQSTMPMLPVRDFLSRLSYNAKSGHHARTLPPTDEQERIETLKAKIDDYCQTIKKASLKSSAIKPTKFNWNKALKQQFYSFDKKGNGPQGVLKNTDWDKLFRQSCKDESLLICAAYLPPKLTSVIIDNQFSNEIHVKLLEIEPSPIRKNPKKSVKKIQEPRKFNKQNSVFKDFREDLDMDRKQWLYDMKKTKLSRFIKDPQELERVQDVLLKHYAAIRDHFMTQISNPNSYPDIEWLDFSKHIAKWQIVDKQTLKTADVDRIFIATNVELEAMEANDDRSLCRYEFYEIIVRLAKTKFYERGDSPTMSHAVARLIEDHILPNSDLVFNYWPWRTEKLWTLEIDSLLKANLDKLRKLYDGLRQGKQFIKYEHLLQSFLAVDSLQATDFQITLALAFSKQLFVEELEQIEYYKRLYFVEFLEFLARLAYLIWPEADEDLDVKLWRMMHKLFVPKQWSVEEGVDLDGGDSESDYDDAVATEIMQEVFPSELYAGYGPLESGFGEPSK